MRSAPGQTLLELLVVLWLLGLLSAVSAGAVQIAWRLGVMTERQIEVQHNLRRGLDRVTEELRWAEAIIPDLVCSLCPDRVTARIPSFNPRRPGHRYVVTFRLDRSEGELERVVGSAVTNLAAEVEGLGFRYLDSDGRSTRDVAAAVQVEISLKGKETGLLSTSQLGGVVFLRNHSSVSPRR